MTTIQNQNLFQVKNEEDVIEIIYDNLNKLIVIFFTLPTNDKDTNDLKKYLLDSSNNNPNIIFLYIDLLNYETGNQLIIQTVPSVVFFYNKNPQLVMTSLIFKEIDKYIEICSQKLLKQK